MPRASSPKPGTSLQGRASALKRYERLAADAPVPKSNSRLIEMTGEKVGTWLVLGREGTSNEGATWACKCTVCGHHRVLSGWALRNAERECPRCAGRPPKEKPPIRLVELPVPREVVVTTLTVRCSACQSFQGFERGRCVMCGRETADLLPHVDGRRCG